MDQDLTFRRWREHAREEPFVVEGATAEDGELLNRLVQQAQRATRAQIARHLMAIHQAMAQPLSEERELFGFQEGWKAAAEEVRNG